MSFEYLKGWRLHKISGKPEISWTHKKVAVCDGCCVTLTIYKVFSGVQMDPPVFQALLIATYQVTVQH